MTKLQWRRFLAAALLLACVVVSPPSLARDLADDARAFLLAAAAEFEGGAAFDPTPEDVTEFRQFVMGNVLHTFYHELGHAFVHQLDLPIVGREEDAVDGLATVLMISEKADEELDEMVAAAADGFAMAHDVADRGEAPDYWGEHSLDIQRFAAQICLIYGSDPEGFADLADATDLPEDERDRCPDAYRQMSDGWATLLSPHWREGGAGGAVPVTYRRGLRPVHRLAAAMIQQSAVIDAAAEVAAETLRLPKDIPVAFEACGVENAWYDLGEGSVTFCYELVHFYADLIVADMLAR